MTTTSSVSNWPDSVVSGLNSLLADNLALYVKTKNFHWHLSDSRHRSRLVTDGDRAPKRLENQPL